MSTPINNIVKSVRPGSVFDDAKQLITSAVSFNQGDLLCLDTSSHILKTPTSETGDSPNFLGVATVTVVNGVLQRPYTTAVSGAQSDPAIPGPLFGVVVQLTLKTGDSLAKGAPVYLDPSDGPQFVSATGSGSAIGVYEGTQGAISGAAAGQQVYILLSDVYTQTIAIGQV